MIGYPPGGSNDTFGRLVARHIGKYIPGHPNVIPKNTPGAGSFLAVNQIFNVAPKDGTVIGIGAPTIPLDEKLRRRACASRPRAELDRPRRLLINMVFTWKTSPVKTFADARKLNRRCRDRRRLDVSIYPTVMNNVFGTKFKLVMGYKGSNEAMLAVERARSRPLDVVDCAEVAHPDWIRTRTSPFRAVRPQRHPELPDVPTAVDLARRRGAAILRAIMNATEVGTAFFTTPGAPPDRVTALRRGCDAAMKDPDLLSEAQKMRVGVSPLPGEELQKLVAEVSNLSPELLEKVRAAYTTTKSN